MIANWIAGPPAPSRLHLRSCRCGGARPARNKPSAAIALAKEIIVAKGAASMYDPVIPRVIERQRRSFCRPTPCSAAT